MKRALFCSVVMICVTTSGFTAELFSGITGLAVFQESQFQGIAPGLCTTVQADRLLMNGDYGDAHLDFYYVGIGWLSDTTLQYGYRLRFGGVLLIPTVGVGANLGFMNGPVTNLYLPVSLILGLVETPRLRIRCWAQLRPYFDPQNDWTFWVGGKLALDIIVHARGWGLYLEPIAGGGGTETLVGLRAGVALDL